MVDDGSSDRTAEIVAGFADPRIRLIHQTPAGVAAARNRGLEAVEAEAILFLDADDWLAPDALARLTGALAAAPRAVAACGPCGFMAEDARPGARPESVLRCPRRCRGRGRRGGDLLEPLLERNLFANGGHLLIRMNAIRVARGFRSGLAYGEDWEFCIRLALQGGFTAVAERAPVLFVRRRREGAYLRMATEMASFEPCMEAVFANPALGARLGPNRLATLRGRAEAENFWVSGRAALAQHRVALGRQRLRRSVRAKPSLRRAAIVAAAHLPRFVARLVGFGPVGPTTRSAGSRAANPDENGAAIRAAPLPPSPRSRRVG